MNWIYLLNNMKRVIILIMYNLDYKDDHQYVL